MKRFVLTAAVALGVASAIYSCNNGKYDALPEVDYGSGQNHLGDDSTKPRVYLGSVEAIINNKKHILAPAFCYQDEDGVMRLVARIKDDNLLRRTLRISYNKFEGKRVDTINAATIDPQIALIMVDTGKFDIAGRQLYKTYTANTGENFGHAVVDIQGVEGGHLHGQMYGKLYKFLPGATGSPRHDINDTMSFELSFFYFKKVGFPVPGEYKKYLEN